MEGVAHIALGGQHITGVGELKNLQRAVELGMAQRAGKALPIDGLVVRIAGSSPPVMYLLYVSIEVALLCCRELAVVVAVVGTKPAVLLVVIIS